MDMDRLRRQFPDEQACQQFFEAVRWQKEPMCPHYSRGMIHCNTAESFASLLECGRVGVFHYMSRDHMSRYLNEFAFRWDSREPKIQKTSKGEEKMVMKPMPILEMLKMLILRCSGIQLRRTQQWGIMDLAFASP